MLTLVAAALGGVIALLAQITLAYLQTRAGKRRKKEESEAAVRVIRFHFYASQRVLQASLETGLWWASEEGLNVAAAGEALNTLADLLPEEQWRTYTAAWRRLQGSGVFRSYPVLCGM